MKAKQTTHKFSPDVCALLVRMVQEHQGKHVSQ
jgi:hypothetical protein